MQAVRTSRAAAAVLISERNDCACPIAAPRRSTLPSGHSKQALSTHRAHPNTARAGLRRLGAASGVEAGGLGRVGPRAGRVWGVRTEPDHRPAQQPDPSTKADPPLPNLNTAPRTSPLPKVGRLRKLPPPKLVKLPVVRTGTAVFRHVLCVVESLGEGGSTSYNACGRYALW